MFRSELKSKLESIFGMKRTTFDAPSESYEQEILFIEVNEATSHIIGKQINSTVRGSLIVFSQMEKMPFGFFNKRIAKADYSLTKDLFFFDIDLNPMSSPARYQNISERRASFVYLYSAQYDPNQGQLTSIEGI